MPNAFDLCDLPVMGGQEDVSTYFSDESLPLRDRFASVAAALATQYPYEVGRTRMVFHVSETEVVKVPRTDEGMFASSGEANWSEEYGKTGFIPVADCRIEFIDELPVLRMEKVSMPARDAWRTFPGWTGSVDCAQVGYDSEGALVAFDL